MVAIELSLTLLGAGAGTVLRFLVGGWINHRTGPGFPWGTLTVNTLGCFGLGLLEGIASGEGALLFILGSGVIAGFTTFSTLMLETLNLALAGEYDRALWNILGSVILGIPALFAGIYLGTMA